MRGSNRLWRALEQARCRNLDAAGAPLPIRGQSGQTRRAVLKALAATGMVAALPPTARAAPAAGPVAIIGGGIAGLSALWHLTQAGIDAHLYEARPRLGGRMLTVTTPQGVALEMGGQLVNTDHADIHALAAAFGVGLVDRRTMPSRSVVLDGSEEIAEDRLAEGLRGIARQIGADADRLDADHARVAPQLDRMSFADYLDAHAGLIPDRHIRALLEATARTEYGVEPGQASAIELIFNLPTVDGTRVSVLGESDEAFVIAGGSGALIAAMAARLADRITTGKRLLRIDPAANGVRLRFLDGSIVNAATVIVATPASVTRQIGFGVPLPGLWRRFLDEVSLGHNAKIQAAMTGRPWETPIGRSGELWQADAAVGTALGWDGGIRPDRGSGGVWTWFLGGDQVAAVDREPAAAIAARFATGVERVVPGMAAAMAGSAWATRWHVDPLTLGGYVNFRPGQLTHFAPCLWREDEGVGVPPLAAGRVHFAGEHLSGDFPGYMNGAAQTGRLAAQAVIGARARNRAA